LYSAVFDVGYSVFAYGVMWKMLIGLWLFTDWSYKILI